MIKENSEILQKRSILLTTNIRFSSQTQSIKEMSLDRIIEQALFLSSEDKLELSKIQGNINTDFGIHTISFKEVESAIKRLIQKNRIIEETINKKIEYRIPKRVKQELEEIERQATHRFDSIVEKLFKYSSVGFIKYKEPFLRFLCVIFSKLGEECVKIIKGNVDDINFTIPLIDLTIKQIQKDFNYIDLSLFKSAALKFFEENDPEYNSIKWNLSQSYFIIKALGFDPSGILLSKEVFGNSIFYLDTNIIISALEGKHRHHPGFLVFIKSCEQLGIDLRVSQITIDELGNWILYQYDLIQKIKDRIPNETLSKIRSIFCQILYEYKINGNDIEIDELFKNFNAPIDKLKNICDIELVDHQWFGEVKNKKEIEVFANELSKKYFLFRKRKKSKSSALHDSIMLNWIKKLREDNNTNNIWLVTIDTTLPGIVPIGSSTQSFAITLPALLQWISPMSLNKNDKDFALIFSEILKMRLLPQEHLFELSDFLVLEELNISCKQLPTEDVEDCIRYLKTQIPILNPENPEDREKLSYNVAKFFADPGRKYNKELEKLRKDVIELSDEKDKMKKELQIEKEANELITLKSSAIKRLIFVIFIWLFFEGITIYLIYLLGEGNNLFQKIASSNYYLIIVFLIFFIGLGYLIIGKKRLKLVAPFFKRIFKR